MLRACSLVGRGEGKEEDGGAFCRKGEGIGFESGRCAARRGVAWAIRMLVVRAGVAEAGRAGPS